MASLIMRLICASSIHFPFFFPAYNHLPLAHIDKDREYFTIFHQKGLKRLFG